MSGFAVGDRLRFVHTASSFGTVVSDVFASPEFCTPRQTVRWDRSGLETAWDPVFLMPIASRPEDDPDEVAIVENGTKSRKLVGMAHRAIFGDGQDANGLGDIGVRVMGVCNARTESGRKRKAVGSAAKARRHGRRRAAQGKR